MDKPTLYDSLIAAGCKVDHHESDLYVKDTPEARAILATSDYQSTPSPFVSGVDGARWLDVPFAYSPFWRAKQDKLFDLSA